MLNSYTIYTDGSDFKKTTRRLGTGGIIIDNNTKEIIGQFSEELDRNQIMASYGTSECSNPFAEMMAVKVALMKFASLIEGKALIILKADYIGVKEWNTGHWKTKEPYIKKIKEEIQDIINHSPWTVDFQWVKGHQSLMSDDAKYNNMVDKLAKGEL